MSDESTPSNGISHIKHVYCEIGGELLSKPNALSQIVEASGGASILVYCNTPSDTDLVEVLLRKRGVAARKLIGNVPQAKLEKTLVELQNGEINTLVVTDIAAKNLNIDDFDLLINYTTPADYDTYAMRIGKTGPFDKLTKIITLVSPMDLTHFNFIKNAVEATFTQEDLPTAEQIESAKLTKLAKQASTITVSDSVMQFAKAILSSKDKEQIVAYLTHNTLEVMPALQSASERDREEAYDDSDDNQQGGRGFRGNGNGNGRNDRNNDRRRGGGRDYDDSRQSGGRRAPYADLDEDYSEQPREDRRPVRQSLPPLRETRVYVGQGKEHGLTGDQLKDLVKSNCGIEPDQIRRIITRGKYTFFDILEENSQAVISGLQELKDSEGEAVLVQKATTISSQRQQDAASSETEEIPTESPVLEEGQATP